MLGMGVARPPRLFVLAGVAVFGLCASATAEVKVWGVAATSKPTKVTGTSNVRHIDASNRSSYGLEPNGTELAWGQGTAGELGNGTKTASDFAAVKVEFPAGTHIVALGEARESGLAIDSTGHGWAWGQNDNGVLCTGLNKATTPQPVPGISHAVAVQGGETHALWLLSNGHVMGCGTNRQGQLGLPESIRETSTPVEIPGLAKVVEISAGQRQSLVRTSTGKVYAFGSNKLGQICQPASVPHTFTPREVALPGPASAISAGGNFVTDGHSMFVVKGLPYGCGDDKSGQIGDGSTATKYTPTLASKVDTLGLTQVIAAGESSVGLGGGNVYTWGSGKQGALGNGNISGFSLVPLLVDTGAVEVSGTAWNLDDR